MLKKLFSKCALISAVTAAATMITGCVTHYKDIGGEYLQRPASGPSSTYYTQYEIGEKKVEGRGYAVVILGFMHIGSNKSCQMGSNPNLTFLDILLNFFSPTKKAIENAKAASLYDICESNQADYLLGTTFSYSVYNGIFYSEINCKTTAFPAYLKKIDVATPIVLDKDQRIEYLNPNQPLKDYSRKERTVVVEK